MIAAALMALALAATATAADPFAYDKATDLAVVDVGSEQRGDVKVRDITFKSPGLAQPVKAFVVVPPGPGPFAGVLWVHWLGTPKSTNRGQYLDEAVAHAARGTASILVDAMWSTPRWYGTRGIERDRESSINQVIAFRRALDVLETVPGVDKSRIGFVGHDYGGMYGMLMAGSDPRPRTYVFIACTQSLLDWAFFAAQPASKADYLRRNADMELTDGLRRAPKSASMLFQFAARDEYVSSADSLVLLSAAPGRKEKRVYDSGHEMDAPEAAKDREGWLGKELAAVP